MNSRGEGEGKSKDVEAVEAQEQARALAMLEEKFIRPLKPLSSNNLQFRFE